jgi:hypothetical protein
MNRRRSAENAPLPSLPRRDFVKKSLVILSALPVLDALTQSSALAQQPPTKPLDPASPQAAALGYVHDAKNTDIVKFPKRTGPEGEKQFCNNCMFLQQGGLKAEGQGGEWGKCALFPDGLVNMIGWCNSWVAKPA